MSQWMHSPLGGDAPPGTQRLRRAASAATSLLMLWLANQVSLVTPHARLFKLRRQFFVWAGADIHPGAKIAGTVRIHHANIQIGDAWIAPGTQLFPGPEARIVIGDGCAIGPETMINCFSHEIGPSEQRAGPSISRPITVGEGTFVGGRSTLMYGSSLGKGCLVGYCSLVREEFGDDLLIVGVPARIVREMPDDGLGGDES